MSRTNQLNRLKQINSVCEQFEDQWLNKKQPRIEDFMTKIEAEDRSELLQELVRIELFYLGENGYTPEIDSYRQRFPDMENYVIRAFDETTDEFRQTVNDANPLSFRTREGPMVGPFKIEQTLGSGGFAEVFLAFDKHQDRPVAVKAMRRFIDANGEPNSRAVQSFVDEAQLLSKLNHPAIAQIYDLDYDEDGFPFVVLEYVKGDSLEFLLRQNVIDQLTAIKLLADTAVVLSEIHQQDIFHRDLKPSNIIVGLDGQPRIVDFGLAVSESMQQERKGEVAGSMAYMSPEQLRGQTHRLDGRSDVWSLGVMLYELLTERLPFRGNDRRVLVDEIFNHNPRPPRQINPNATVGLEKVCMEALQKDSTLRTATAQDFAAALRAELGEFSDRMADVSKNLSATAKGRAELRLATQARIWNEKPESQRLPTLSRYASILTRTDSMTRTVAESRMMTAAFWYFAKRIAVGILAISIVSFFVWHIFNTNKFSVISHDDALKQLVHDIGSAETETEIGLYIANDDNPKTVDSLIDATSLSFDEKQKSLVENYLKTLLRNEFFGEKSSPESVARLNKVLHEYANIESFSQLQDQVHQELPESIAAKIRTREGIVTSEFAICANITTVEFDRLNIRMHEFDYELVEFDFTQDHSTVACIWHRRDVNEINSPALTMQQVKTKWTNRKQSDYQSVDIVFPDYFSGESGFDGLLNFEVRYVDYKTYEDGLNDRFEKQLELSERFAGCNTDAHYFLRARAHYHLRDFVSCRSELENVSSEFSGTLLFIDLWSRVHARLGDRNIALKNLNRFISAKSNNHQLSLYLKFQVLWFLGEREEARTVAEQLSRPRFKAKCHSIMAESLAEEGETDLAKSELIVVTKLAPKLELLSLLVPELQYFREQAGTIATLVDSKYLPAFSAQWNFKESAKASRFTGGSRGYLHLLTRHKDSALNYAEDGFWPTKIRIAKKPDDGELKAASLWTERRDSQLRPLLEIELRALAIAGKIALESAQSGNVDLALFSALQDSSEPTLRTELIASFRELKVNIRNGILTPLKTTNDPGIQYGLLSALALYDITELAGDKSAIIDVVNLIETSNSDSGVASALKLIRQKLDVPTTSDKRTNVSTSNWHENCIGQRMIRSNNVWMASTELTEKNHDVIVGDSVVRDNYALAGVSFYDAARILNRLSKKEGIPEDQWSFEPNENGLFAAGMKIKSNFKELQGYRFPTIDEWRDAYRRDTNTTWDHGNSLRRVGLFSRFLNSSSSPSVANLLPNRQGFFDMGGNVIEWLMPEDFALIDDESELRVIGGSYKLTGKNVKDLAFSSVPHPKNLVQTTGIRVVRKINSSEILK